MLGLVVLLALLPPLRVQAHARVVRLDPPAGAVLQHTPGRVTITFSEPVSPFGSGVEVLSPTGRRVSSGVVASGSELTVPIALASEQGRYQVSWRVVAEDTHPSRGSYSFSVGQATATPQTSSSDLGAAAPAGLLLQALARLLHFAGFALAFGGFAFQLLVLGGTEPSARLRRLVQAGVGLLLLAAPVALAGQAASLGGAGAEAGAVFADLLSSAFGRVLALQVGAAILLWAILGALRDAGRRGGLSVLLLGAGLALVDGLEGHTIPGLPGMAAQLLTALHVAAMAFWTGGVAALLVTLPDSRAHLGRFGRQAAAAVALLIASGLALALVHLTGPGDLTSTGYGFILLLKLVAVALALTAAGLGLRRGRSGAPELIALAGVVALAGLLASLPPPR